MKYTHIYICIYICVCVYIYISNNTRDYCGDKTNVIMQTLRLHQLFPMGQEEKHLNS